MKAVFIDIDNTLLDFDEYVRRTMQTGFRKFGLKPYEPYMYDVFNSVNDKLWQAIERGELTFMELKRIRWNRVFEALSIDYDGVSFEEYFRKQLNESAVTVPGAYELLDALYGRTVLCSASNGPFKQQLHRLEMADMLKYFSYNFISEDIGASKPSEEFYDEAFRRLNDGRDVPIMPQETLVIGDSLTSDMKGGIDYGMHTCHYRHNDRHAAAAELKSRVEITADSLAEVLDKVNGLI